MTATADRWAGPFLWAVLLLAAGAGVAWSVIDPTRVVWVVVSVLVVTCPCALSLAVPSALLAAASAMGREGLLLRKLDAIPALARMRTLFIDKTGTLTEARLHCTGALMLGAVDPRCERSLGGTASSLAAWSTHPLSRALHEAFAVDGTVWDQITEAPGHGVEGRDAQGRRWRLGDAEWACETAPASSTATSVCLSVDGRGVALFVFDERVRTDSRPAIDALHADGVAIHLLSGDEAGRVARFAKQLGLDSGSGGLTPEGKLVRIRNAQQGGQFVAMLGDGVNDAPVLAQADLSIAMGEGALVARTQADAVLVSNRLADLVRARARACRAMRVVRQNLWWAAVYNACCIPLALSGHLPPWAAGLGMACSSLFVITNSMRLAR